MATMLVLSVVLFLTSCLISAALLYHNADGQRSLARVRRSRPSGFLRH
jgi:hypothetical protein